MAHIKEAFLKDVLSQYDRSDISFSRMCEKINEEAVRGLPTEEEQMIYFNNHSNCYADVNYISNNVNPAMTRLEVLKFGDWLLTKLTSNK